MKIVSEKHNIYLDLVENQVTNLVIENRKVFSDVIGDIWMQLDGQEGSLVLSEKGKILPISKNIVFISNPVTVDCNEKRIINALYKELSEIVKEQMVIQYKSVNSVLINFLENVQNQVPYHTSIDLDLDITGMFKLYNLNICSEKGSLIEVFIDYIRALSRICKISIIIVLNLKLYFTNRELEEIYKICFYEKLFLINIEGIQTEPVKDEKVFIIDKDLCIINV